MWNETPSEHFVARHEDRDASDAEGVLELLEATRARLARAFAVVPTGVDVVLHGSEAQLLLARPRAAPAGPAAPPPARPHRTRARGQRGAPRLAPRPPEEPAGGAPGARRVLPL